MFGNIYHGKKILLTGHTGFKGTWLTTWLLNLGANVIGVSKDIPTTPSMFNILGLSDKIEHITFDIRNSENLTKVILDKNVNSTGTIGIINKIAWFSPKTIGEANQFEKDMNVVWTKEGLIEMFEKIVAN